MDDKVQKYIDEQIEKQRNAYQEEKMNTLKELKLGEIKKKPKGAKKEDYPEVDEFGERYRFIPASLTDDEYEELKRHIPHEEREESKQNGWCSFAIVVTFIALIVTLIGLGGENELVVIIGGSLFGYMLFFMLPIINLLAKIEYNQRKKD